MHTSKRGRLKCMDVDVSLCFRELGIPLCFKSITPLVYLIPSLPTSVPLIFFH